MKTLLRAETVLTPESSRHNLYFPFEVPEGVKKLKIAFSYTPKYLSDEARTEALIEEGFQKYILPEDRGAMAELRTSIRPLVNLVTISLDSPRGYTGAAHRQASEQLHFIGEGISSPGFEDMPVTPGTWRICAARTP